VDPRGTSARRRPRRPSSSASRVWTGLRSPGSATTTRNTEAA
jgi:hypothetical protein